MPSRPQSSSSQARRRMSQSIVREALVWSVAWRPVSLKSSQESNVPTAGRAQLLAALCGAPVLPDQRPVDRLAARWVPGDDRLALVGDPDRLELGPLDTGVDDSLDGDAAADLPDFAGVVLDPARPGEVLLELRVGPPGDPSLRVEDEAGGPRRPLVDRQDHDSPGKTWQLRVNVELKRRPSSKTIEARAKGKTAPGKPAGAAQEALR